MHPSFLEILHQKKRLDGSSFYDHNVKVVKLLDGYDDLTIKAAWHHGLNDVPEDVKPFLTKLKSISKIQSSSKLGPEELRQILLVTVQDPRVIILKLAIKLQNLRTSNVFDEKEQRRLAQQVLDIYAPLGYRLGAEWLRTQLEDEALNILYPRKYREIQNFLQNTREEREALIHTTITQIKKRCPQILKIKGRPKHIYSIWKKITSRGVKLDKQYDHLGVRVITKSVDDCYQVLGTVNELFDPVPGRIKDYIAHPKPNGYQSIHTSVLYQGRRLEVQIRTEDMDLYAEEGVAAHWRYKGQGSTAKFERRTAWLKSIMEAQNDSEQLKDLAVNVFTDELFCYTPKGDVYYFPIGSSILDFSYRVHEQVGNKTIGARVNGKFCTMRTLLKQGDVIEVLTNKQQRPRRHWVKYAFTSKARQKIRKGLKEHENLPPVHWRPPNVRDQLRYASLVESMDYPAECVLAKCCHPIPGDKVVGIPVKRLVRVHNVDCRQADKEKNRCVQVNWRSEFTDKLLVVIQATERSGLLADLLHVITRQSFIVESASAKIIGEGHTECSFTIVPKEYELLVKLVNSLRNTANVYKVIFS